MSGRIIWDGTTVNSCPIAWLVLPGGLSRGGCRILIVASQDRLRGTATLGRLHLPTGDGPVFACVCVCMCVLVPAANGNGTTTHLPIPPGNTA